MNEDLVKILENPGENCKDPLKLVFTSDGVMIGVIIKTVEWYDLTSRENLTIRVKQNTDFAYDPVACDLVKTRLSESKAEVE